MPAAVTTRTRRTPPAAPATAVTAHFARSAILAAAQKVFSQHGIDATRVEDILLAANIARRTFYKYFAGKEDVLAALYEIWTGEILRAVEEARARKPDSPLAGIRAGVDIFLGFYRASPRALRELVGLAMRADSPLAARRAWLRAQIVRLLDDAVFALDGRRLDHFLYHGLISALEGISLELGGPGTTEADVERARAVTHALLDHALDLPRPRALPKRA
jgi:AcrR family transcriptional regulator